jgi:hypothetical protein
MVIVYLFASSLGALTTFVVLSSYGWLIALFCAPLAGSVVATIVAVVYDLRADERSLCPAVDEADFVHAPQPEAQAA